jgi:hypothetical protein
MIEIHSSWRHNDRKYTFTGRKPTNFSAFQGLGYSLEDSKFLANYCARLYCDQTFQYSMVVYEINDYYFILNVLENNERIIDKNGWRMIYSCGI